MQVEQENSVGFSVNNLVDKVYVLTVKTFGDRIAHIEREMSKHGIEFQFVFAHDIPDLDVDILESVFSNSELTLAQKSLVLKHIYTWRDAKEHSYQRILVFEDDVVLAEEFCSVFKKVMNASISVNAGYLIFLGGADAKVPDYFLLSKETLVQLPIATTEAYVTDLEAINFRLDWLVNHKINLPSDHLIQKMDPELGIVNYWSRKPIVEQGSVKGDFDSYLDSHRRKHSKLYNVLRYRWNKFQRHVLRAKFAGIRRFFSISY